MNLVWAFAAVSQSDRNLIPALAKEVERRLTEFTVQDLVGIAWVTATVRHADAKLSTVLSRESERRASAFNAQDLAKTA